MLLKRDPKTVFYCKFLKIFKSTYFEEHPHQKNIQHLTLLDVEIFIIVKCNWIAGDEYELDIDSISSSGSSGIRTHNNLVGKRTLNDLAKLVFKWLSCIVSTYIYGELDCMLLSCDARVSEWIYT